VKPKILAGVGSIEMACRFTVTLDRMAMSADVLLAYMDVVMQVVPPTASVAITDKGDTVSLAFEWAEQRQPNWKIGEVPEIESPAESSPAESSTMGESGALPRRGGKR
jgi:hypothetical protein